MPSIAIIRSVYYNVFFFETMQLFGQIRFIQSSYFPAMSSAFARIRFSFLSYALNTIYSVPSGTKKYTAKAMLDTYKLIGIFDLYLIA